MATVADLGARVLRRLGIAAVAAADRPAPGATVNEAAVAERALRLVGVNPVPRIERGAASGTVHDAEDIGLQALQRLGVVASDETPAAADLADAAAAARAVHESMNQLGLVSWGVNEVPYLAVRHYALMTAQMLAPTYGKSADMALYAAAQEVLRLMALSGPAGHARALEAVASVHQALLAAGLVDWAQALIPAAHAEDYAALAAARLAPIYGKAFDPGDAEARVRRATLLRLAPALAEEKVLAVHASLSARGLARWSVFDIPDYAEEPMVVLASNLLAPEFGLPADERGGIMAMHEIARVIALGPTGEMMAGSYF